MFVVDSDCPSAALEGTPSVFLGEFVEALLLSVTQEGLWVLWGAEYGRT